MNASRITVVIRSLTWYSLQNRVPFSSSPVSLSRFCNFFSDNTKGGSTVYQHALKFQRPTTIDQWSHLKNFVSFIGSVDRPLNRANTKDGRLGVYTLLSVKSPCMPDCSFRILLMMWDEIAAICVKHLKPNDFIYVSGHLESYTKADKNGMLGLYYQVTVKELNYVAQPGKRSTHQKYEELQSNQVTDLGEAGMQRCKNQLYLWQVYFTNPLEWWDNRKTKRNPRQPDFKHKDTGEALWLRQDDPPWIRKQLELLDSKMAESLGEQVSSRSCISEWL